MNIRSFTKQPILTIAIQRHRVRWTVGSAGRIAAAGSVALPDAFVDDGVVRDPEACARALTSDPAFRGSSRMRAVIALPAQRSVFRHLEVPALKGKQFAEMVDREIRREMPMLAENAYVSWTPAGARGNNALVFVVGVARDVLDSHVAAVRVAGLCPVSADLRIISAARAIGEPDCIVANVEDDEAEIGIFRSGVPAIIRSITLAKRAGEDGWADQLAEELARTLKFYRDSHRDEQVIVSLPVMFVGGEARRALMSPEITSATGHDVAMPPLRLAVSPEPETIVFAANIGLALKDLAA